MKKILVCLAALMLCSMFTTPALAARHKVPVYPNKETTVDMSKMNRIFIGWVDMNADDWGAHGYATKQEWMDVIASLNSSLNSNLIATDLTGRTVVPAKNADDVNAKDCDLYVKFTDVRVDYDNYHLILAIHFIDPKTGQEIGSIPVRPYYGNDWGLRGYLNEALKGVAAKLKVEITAEPGKKH
jgi:hypothetical protein